MRLVGNQNNRNLLFLSIGSIVGSGWLFGSFYTAQIAGPAAILSWVLGGLGVIGMKVDFLLLLISSGIIFWIAQKTTVDFDTYESEVYKTLMLEMRNQESMASE